MLFAIYCNDKPAHVELRLATRPKHLEYLKSWGKKLTLGGPMLDPEGKPIGSIVLLEAADRAEAEAYVAGDPYTKAGLFESSFIRPMRIVVKDGELLG